MLLILECYIICFVLFSQAKYVFFLILILSITYVIYCIANFPLFLQSATIISPRCKCLFRNIRALSSSRDFTKNTTLLIFPDFFFFFNRTSSQL